MTSFCSCTKSNNAINDNILDQSIHSVLLVKDKKINNNCNIFSIFNIFWCESNNNELESNNDESVQENNINGNIILVKK